MSAFVVGKNHINAMLNAALNVQYKPMSYYHEGKRYEVDEEMCHEIGQTLLDECVRSVMYRYDDSDITKLPGKTNAEWLIPFEFRHIYDTLPAVTIIKITQCYMYQSCQHPEWESSRAKEFCKALIENQFSRLPGYDDAPWEWTKPVNKNLRRIV